MALPVGVITATVTFGEYLDFTGDPAAGEMLVTPSTDLVWEATGAVLFRKRERVRLVAAAGSIVLPATDQEGFTDGQGNAVTNWTYEFTRRLNGQAATYHTVMLPTEGATGVVVDLDALVPVTGSSGDVVELPAVTSVDGLTGPVDLADRYGPKSVAQDGRLPVFTRVNGGAPVFTAAAQNPAPGALPPTTSGSIYWPNILDARAALGAAALDEFYLYYSTDHELTHANSGVWLATGPTALGPWTGRGRVYIDNVSGTQTETPTVFPAPTGTGLIMLYQQSTVAGAVGSQTTLYATSPDGLVWTRGGIAIDITLSTPGDGHTGYATVTRMGAAVYSHHLRGGQDFPHFGLSVSHDGRTFRPVHMLGYARDQLPDGRRIEWNSGWVVRWRGALLWVGLLSNFTSGSAAKDGRLGVAPITEDLIHLLGTPRYQLYPTAGAETTNYRSTFTFVDRDGSLILYYQSGNSFYAARGE